MMPERIKIAFIEDHELLLENYIEYFESDERFTCAFAYGSVVALKDAAKAERLQAPDLVLLDIQLPEINGIEGIALINKFFPNASVIMMTAFEDAENLMSAFQNGASGFLTKNMSLAAVKEAVLSIFNDGAALSPTAAKTLISGLNQKRRKINALIGKLTPREKEIAQYIKDGLSYKEIALQLFISSRTVNQHLKHIYQKIGVNSRSQLAAKMAD
ncbi:MAG: hypothetical protein RI924_843 [Bacteroidota bacterium]|jgi:DNA-binding NarL/FixJ family response regulator